MDIGKPLVRLAAFMRPHDDDFRANALHAGDQAVGPAPHWPLIIDGNNQHAVAAAFGNNAGPTIKDIVLGAGLCLVFHVKGPVFGRELSYAVHRALRAVKGITKLFIIPARCFQYGEQLVRLIGVF